MTNFTVVGTDLRGASSRLNEAAVTVGDSRHVAAVRRIATAMSASSSAAASMRCAEGWADAKNGWRAAASAHADALTGSAAAYDRADEQAARELWGLA